MSERVKIQSDTQQSEEKKRKKRDEENTEEETKQKLEQVRKVSNDAHMDLPLLVGVKPLGKDALDSLVRNVWEPTLTITGQEGLTGKDSGNVIHPSITMKQSIRLPP